MNACRWMLTLILLLGPAGLPGRASQTAAAADGEVPELRVIVFGAHPDDAELKAGGTAAKCAALAHRVKFVSVTNGDIGHWRLEREELAQRRLAEVQAAAKVLGIETEVLPIHDGELEPTLDNRHARDSQVACRHCPVSSPLGLSSRS